MASSRQASQAEALVGGVEVVSEALIDGVDVVLGLEQRRRNLPLLQPLAARRQAVQHRLLQVLLQVGELRRGRHQIRDGLKRLKLDKERGDA